MKMLTFHLNFVLKCLSWKPNKFDYIDSEEVSLTDYIYISLYIYNIYNIYIIFIIYTYIYNIKNGW